MVAVLVKMLDQKVDDNVKKVSHPGQPDFLFLRCLLVPGEIIFGCCCFGKHIMNAPLITSKFEYVHCFLEILDLNAYVVAYLSKSSMLQLLLLTQG